MALAAALSLALPGCGASPSKCAPEPVSAPAPVAAPATAPASAHAGKTEFFLGNAREAMEKNPLGKDEKLKVFPLFENADHTVNLIQARGGAVPSHYHADHDELVVILEGAGTFTIEGRAREVKAGDVQVIPRGAVHSFVHAGGPTTAVVSIFSPRFDPKDRIPAPAPAP